MWDKLYELAAQNQFELLFEDGQEHRDKDLRLVYLMNDAVESFLVFKNATVTGDYIDEFEGRIWIDVTGDGERKILFLHQEENIVSIFFDDLEFEYHLYDYSRVGHFWVDGYEYLRQLEFKIAILGDKYEYIGEEVCSEVERDLAQLVNFPPLSYLFYPAVSEKYIVPRENPWYVSEEAIAVMRAAAKRAGDDSFARWLKIYEKMPAKFMSRIIAGKLHRTRHIDIVKTLMQMFKEGCAEYPCRRAFESEFQEKEDTEIFIEEPFTYASDGIETHIYKGVWQYGIINTRMRIREIEDIGE